MTNRYYHGTRTELTLRDLIAPAAPSAADDPDPASVHVLLTANLDEAIWSAELAEGGADRLAKLGDAAHWPRTILPFLLGPSGVGA